MATPNTFTCRRYRGSSFVVVGLSPRALLASVISPFTGREYPWGMRTFQNGFPGQQSQAKARYVLSWALTAGAHGDRANGQVTAYDCCVSRFLSCHAGLDDVPKSFDEERGISCRGYRLLPCINFVKAE